MKTSNQSGRVGERGLTLPEMMVAMAVFMLVITGVVFIHLSGQRMNLLARSKLGASDEARAAIGKMISEIRSAGVVRIGQGNMSGFTERGHGELQVGNALEILPVKGVTNQYVRYFWDLNDSRLKRTENGNAAVLVVANSISNSMVFTAEDYLGNTNNQNFNNRVIGVKLEFFQLQSPTMPIGPGCLYDYYCLRTKITRRALE